MSRSVKKVKIEPLPYETYVAFIQNSVGSKLFKNFYIKVNGKKADIMRDGEVSCALFVSSILVLSKFLKNTHGTVDSTAKDLQKHGWRPILKPKVGSVIVWESKEYKQGDPHKHVGFYIGNNRAISNDYQFKHPAKHHWTYGGKRKVEAILHHPKLMGSRR